MNDVSYVNLENNGTIQGAGLGVWVSLGGDATTNNAGNINFINNGNMNSSVYLGSNGVATGGSGGNVTMESYGNIIANNGAIHLRSTGDTGGSAGNIDLSIYGEVSSVGDAVFIDNIGGSGTNAGMNAGNAGDIAIENYGSIVSSNNFGIYAFSLGGASMGFGEEAGDAGSLVLDNFGNISGVNAIHLVSKGGNKSFSSATSYAGGDADEVILRNSASGVISATNSGIVAESIGGRNTQSGITSGNGNSVIIENDGEITAGDIAVKATSRGGTNNNSAVLAGSGGVVEVHNNGTITSTSMSAIEATSSGGIGGLGGESDDVIITNSGTLIAGQDGVDAESLATGGDSGDIHVKSRGIIEAGANGIVATAKSEENGMGGEIDIRHYGEITAGNIGIRAKSEGGASGSNNLDGGDIYILNAGIVNAGSGASISAESGSLSSGNDGGNIMVENYNHLDGHVDLSSQGLDNGVTFLNKDRGVLNMDGGEVSVVQGGHALFYNFENSIIKSVSGESEINVVSNAGNLSTFQNEGIVDMGNQDFNDQLTIDAHNIIMDSTSVTYLDVTNSSLNSSDLLVLNGTNVTGKSLLKIDGINTSPPTPVDTILVVDVNAANNDVSFSSNYVALSNREYQLFDGADIGMTSGDWYLHDVGFAKHLYGNPALAFDASDLLAQFNVGNVVNSDFTYGKDIRAWARVFGSKGHSDTQYVSRDSKTFGSQFGADMKVSDSFSVGATIGHGNVDSNGYSLDTLETELKAKMVGVSAKYQAPNNPLSIEASAAYGKLEANNHVNDGGYINDIFKGDAITGRIAAGYEFQAGDDWSIEPKVDASYSEVRFDKYTDSAGAHIVIDNTDKTEFGTSVRVNNKSINGFNFYLQPRIATVIGGDVTMVADHEAVSIKGDDYSYGASAGLSLDLSTISGNVLNLDGALSVDAGYMASENTNNTNIGANIDFKF